MDLMIKVVMLVIFFGVMIGIGLYCRKHATDVNGFVLGGRNVGPWLTAFAYGTSYFSAVVFVGYAGQFGWKYGIAATWAGLEQAFKAGGFGHHFHLSDSLYSQPLQRFEPAVWHGV